MTGLLDANRVVDQWQRLQALGPPPPWWRFRARARWCADVRAIQSASVSMLDTMLRDLYPAEAVARMTTAHTFDLAKLAKQPHPEGFTTFVVPTAVKLEDK